MKKILFINERLGGGGAERVMVLLANELAEKGYDITIALFCDTDVPYYDLNNKIKLVYLKNERRLDRFFTDNRLEKTRIVLQKKSKLVDYLYTLLCIDEAKTKPLKEHLKNNSYDDVISFLVETNIATIRAAKHCKCKVIISERNVPVNYRVPPAVSSIRKNTYKDCDLCVFQTKEIRDWYGDDLKDKSKIILNPIKEDLPAPFSGRNRKKIVTNFCGFKEQKNLPLLIKAFAMFVKTHKDYKLVLYGNGNKSFFSELINELGIRPLVEIKPFSYDIHNEIIDYKMFVSSSDFEGISNSMLEAMAIGLPTICTDCDGGGARETIRDHVNGILVPKGDCSALARAMSEVADDEQLARKLSENSIKIKNDLKMDKVIKEWISVL